MGLPSHFLCVRHEYVVIQLEHCSCTYCTYDLEGVLDLIVREAGEGSLGIVVQFRTLKIYECLWKDYSSGQLNELAEERLLKDEIKNMM